MNSKAKAQANSQSTKNNQNYAKKFCKPYLKQAWQHFTCLSNKLH